MLAKLSFLAAATEADLAIAIGNKVISNRCSYNIWLWGVDQDYDSGPIHIPARTKYSKPFRSACNSCGSSLKISKSNNLISGAHTKFEYSLPDVDIWYDISFVDCIKGGSASDCPSHDVGLSMESPEEACGKAHCDAGNHFPNHAYYVDLLLQKPGLKEPVFTCPGKGTDMDHDMEVCSDEAPLKRSIAGRVVVDNYASTRAAGLCLPTYSSSSCRFSLLSFPVQLLFSYSSPHRFSFGSCESTPAALFFRRGYLSHLLADSVTMKLSLSDHSVL